VIDWYRMAEPQADGYDTAQMLALVRRARGGKPERESMAHFSDGTVAAGERDVPLLPPPRWMRVDGDHPNMLQAIGFVERWALAERQWRQIVHQTQCFTDLEAMPGVRLASASHSVDGRFGVIGVTVDCPLATAQAIVHETAHHKLRAMGVCNERAYRLVVNPPDDLFPSPVVLERLRPMTAVVHAEYSFIHVTQLDIVLLEQERDADVRADLLRLLARNVPRMQCGFDTLVRHLKVDDDGRKFFDAFLSWSARVLQDGRRILQETGYPSR
jgi:hypothetical protein